MNSAVFYEKMSDWDVVQRVMDYWSPVGYGFRDWPVSETQDEYDNYISDIILKLKEGNASLLQKHLEYLVFQYMGISESSVNQASVRFFSWSLQQVWKGQQKIRQQYADLQ